MRDNDDEMVRLLRQIAENTGKTLKSDKDITQEITMEGESAESRVGLIPPKSYVTVETADMEYANDNGTVTLEPGDSVPLVEHANHPKALYAVGATDIQDVEYTLMVDDEIIGNRTNSPLGLVNDPFSFVESLGGAIPAEDQIAYVAHYDAGASGSVNLAARIHLELQ